MLKKLLTSIVLIFLVITSINITKAEEKRDYAILHKDGSITPPNVTPDGDWVLIEDPQEPTYTPDDDIPRKVKKNKNKDQKNKVKPNTQTDTTSKSSNVTTTQANQSSATTGGNSNGTNHTSLTMLPETGTSVSNHLMLNMVSLLLLLSGISLVIKFKSRSTNK